MDMNCDTFKLTIRGDNSIEATYYPCDGAAIKANPSKLDEQLSKDISKAVDDLANGVLLARGGGAVTDLGDKLYRAIFAHDVQIKFETALLAVKAGRDSAGSKRLRVAITVDPESKAFTWPLELLYDNSDPSFPVWLAAAKPMIALSRSSVLGIELTLKREETPLRVLMILSNPCGKDLEGRIPADILRTIGEQAQVPGGGEEKLDVKVIGIIDNGEHIPGIHYLGWRAESGRMGGLDEVAPGWRPQVVHFIGHGSYEEGSKAGNVGLEGTQGVVWCPAETFADFLEELRPRVVLLQACEKPNPRTERAFMCVADHLVERKIPAVVATQFPLASDHAILFAKTFYNALLEGNDIDEAVQLGRALVKRFTAAEYPHCFATPALFIYDPSGVITKGTEIPPPLVTDEAKAASAIREARSWAEDKDEDYDEKIAADVRQSIDKYLGAAQFKAVRRDVLNGLDYWSTNQREKAVERFNDALAKLHAPAPLGAGPAKEAQFTSPGLPEAKPPQIVPEKAKEFGAGREGLQQPPKVTDSTPAQDLSWITTERKVTDARANEQTIRR